MKIKENLKQAILSVNHLKKKILDKFAKGRVKKYFS